MKRHLKTTWKHIRRSPYQTLVTVTTMTLTFFVMSVFLLTVITLQTILSDFEKRPSITAFFSDIKTEEAISELDQKLKGTGKVESTKYVSKEDALAIYQEQNKEDPLLLEMVTADILPASLEIYAKDPAYLEDLAKILKEETGVEDVVYLQEEIEALTAWIRAIRAESIILASSLGAVLFLVVLTIISMKIAMKHDEIEILRLLGATNWYIRWPFILEGGIYGFVSALLAWIAAFLRLMYATPYLQGYILGSSLFPEPSAVSLSLPLLLVMLIVGITLGTMGSFLALLRYLR